MSSLDLNKVHLIPYVEINGIRTFSDSFILSMFERIYDEGTYFTYFFGKQEYNPQKMLHLLKTEQNAISFILQYDTKLVGIISLDGIQFNRAFGHCIMFKEWWGKEELVLITKEAVSRLLNKYSVIIGVPPVVNTHAVGFLEKLGWHRQCTIPNYYTDVIGDFVDGAMFTIAKEV